MSATHMLAPQALAPSTRTTTSTSSSALPASHRRAAASFRSACSSARSGPVRLGAPRPLALRVSATAATEVKASEAQEEFYEVYLSKPLGLRFARGNDGQAYISKSDARLGNTDEDIEVADKIVAVSASFGEEVWEAEKAGFGQVMYAIRTRNGQVYLKLQRRGGDLSVFEELVLTEAEKAWRAERAGGNYGQGTKEVQQRNYVMRKEAERKRRELFDDALAKFKKGQYEQALIDFEDVIGLEPKNYLGDDFARTTQIYRVSQYNVACCYSAMEQTDAGLDALASALAVGFEDYEKVRKDANLAFLRQSPKFKVLIDKYDEPIMNEAALNAIKNLFSFGKKD